MSARSSPQTTLRACDRCFRHKTQCDFDSEGNCARCLRLGVECTTQRPLRQRGRPPKASARRVTLEHAQASSPAASRESLTTGAGFIADLLKQVAGSTLDEAHAARLLESVLSHNQRLGVYGILRNEQESEHLATFTSDRHVWADSLLCGLMAIALELCSERLAVLDQEKADSNKGLFLAHCLSHVFPASYGYDASASDALLLSLLSCTWCFSSELARVSVRWNGIAKLIMAELLPANASLYAHTLGIVRTVEQDIFLCIALQERVLSLLRYVQPPPSSPTQLLSITPRERFPQTYIGLFAPLIRALDLVLQRPEPNTQGWTDAYEELEAYFLFFPPCLLRLSDIAFLYQAEAMVSMHGLFIILYAKQDLLRILLEPLVLNDEVLPHALGHSLLLGEVLPNLERLDSGFEGLGALTVFCILVSCAVQIGVLNRLAMIGQECYPISSHFTVPETLASCSLAHLKTLSTIRRKCRRFDSPLLVEIQKMLESCHHRVVLGYDNGAEISAAVLMLYRWTDGGTGSDPLSENVAHRLWEFPFPPEVDVKSLTGSTQGLSVSLIEQVCSPDSRICEPGFFDMSIIVR